MLKLIISIFAYTIVFCTILGIGIVLALYATELAAGTFTAFFGGMVCVGVIAAAFVSAHVVAHRTADAVYEGLEALF